MLLEDLMKNSEHLWKACLLIPTLCFYAGWLTVLLVSNSISCSPRLKEGHLAIIPTDSPWLVKAMLAPIWPGTADDSSQSGTKVLHSLLPSSLLTGGLQFPASWLFHCFCAVSHTPQMMLPPSSCLQLVYRKKRNTKVRTELSPELHSQTFSLILN